MSLHLVPVTRDTALEFISVHHRHSRRPKGYRGAVGASVADVLVGVAIVGRPINRHLDDGTTTSEILRVCTDGTKNACSFLYGAGRRLSRALGYIKTITYTLTSESGACLRAAGFVQVAEVTARAWDCPSRPRGQQELFPRIRWEAA